MNQFVDFQVAELSKFIDHSVGPKLTLFMRACATFNSDTATFDMYASGHAKVSYLDLLLSHETSTFCKGIGKFRT